MKDSSVAWYKKCLPSWFSNYFWDADIKELYPDTCDSRRQPILCWPAIDVTVGVAPKHKGYCCTKTALFYRPIVALTEWIGNKTREQNPVVIFIENLRNIISVTVAIHSKTKINPFKNCQRCCVWWQRRMSLTAIVYGDRGQSQNHAIVYWSAPDSVQTLAEMCYHRMLQTMEWVLELPPKEIAVYFTITTKLATRNIRVFRMVYLLSIVYMGCMC